MISELAFLKTALVTLFVALDPPGLAPIFLGLTAQMTPSDRLRTARRAVVIALGILAAAAVIGEPLLRSLGVSMPAFRIAGGLLLLIIACEMVFEKREQRKAHAAEETVAQDHPHDIAAFPLAIPLMAGPGAITATILQAGAAGGSALKIGMLMGALLLVIAACYAAFRFSDVMGRLLGNTGQIVFSRLLGVVLAAMAVQIIGDGVMAFG